MQTLDEYQHAGALFLATNKKAFLGDEPGEVGKTLQAIRACDMIGARTVLVICPRSVVVNWRREFEENSLLDPVLEIYTPLLAADALPWLKPRYDAIIYDEAHYAKNPKSKRTQAFYGEDIDAGPGSIAARSDHIFLLSGSPAPNDPGEIWTHLHALRPDLIRGPKGPLPHLRFVNVFCNVRRTPFGPKVEGVRPSKLPRLRGILSTFMLRRLTGMTPLPELSIEPLYVEPGISLKGASEDMALVAKALREGGLEGLRNVAKAKGDSLRRLLGLAKILPVVSYVTEWLTHNDGKICVYAWHTEVIERLRKAFPTFASIDGSTKNRQAEVDKLQNDDTCRGFIGQMQAAGEAITLTRATETLLVEPSWVPKDNRQTIKRIHRRGQTRPCLARFVTVVGSVDEDINRALRKKVKMIDAMLGEESDE